METTVHEPHGPGVPFRLLFLETPEAPPSLPAAFRAIYPGDWHLPELTDRPYVYSNFAPSRDGRISFNEPGMVDASHVTKAFAPDRWLRLMGVLHGDYGVRHLLCEGGARVFAGMLDAGLVDEEFLTWCPTFVGRSPDRFRPSYTEGVAWTPDTAPYSKPISLHRAGDYLFLRTRVLYPAEE